MHVSSISTYNSTHIRKTDTDTSAFSKKKALLKERTHIPTFTKVRSRRLNNILKDVKDISLLKVTFCHCILALC